MDIVGVIRAIKNRFLRNVPTKHSDFTGEKEKKEDKSTYGLESFVAKKRYGIDLTPYLQRFLKEEYQEVLPKGYYEIVLSSEGGRLKFNGVDVAGIYRDGAYTMTLFKYPRKSVLRKIKSLRMNPHAIACIGFDIDKKEKKTIMVTQIQGVPGRKSELKYYRWEKMLLKIAVDWARKNEFSKVQVIRAEKNQWHNDGRHKNLYLKYDVTARRSGFTFNQEKDVYELNLET